MSERQLPTPGDWRIWYVSPHGRPYIIADDRPIIAQVYRYSVAYGGLPAEANAALIAAAGTAAHACEQLGYDGTRAIEALPGLLEALGLIVDTHDARSELYTSDADCAAGMADRARAALAAAKPGPISPSDPAVLRAGLAQFGPSHDGAVERDIAAAKSED